MGKEKKRIKCFGYITDENSRVLILGSMPSEKSLEKSEYYAHPQNRFRRVIAAVAESKYDGSYAQLIENLSKLKVALWDVIGECEREGSSDAAIRDAEPNDIAGLRIEFTRLPSTSPLNARTTFDELVRAYSAFIKGQ